MKKKIIVTIIAVLVVVVLGSELLRNSTSEENCMQISGLVTEVSEGGNKDVVIKIDGSHTAYYINRGLENGVKLKNLQNDLLNKNATLTFNPRNSILGIIVGNGNSIKEIYKLQKGSNLLFRKLQ